MKELSNILKLAPIMEDEEDKFTFSKRSWISFCLDKGIGDCFFDVKLAHLILLDEFSKEKVKAWLVNKSNALIFYGSTGAGKTHMGLSLLRYFFELRENSWVQYLTASQVLSEGDTLGEQSLIEKYGCCDLLMIDDLGVEECPKWKVKYLYAITDKRFTSKKPTIITTNLNESELSEIYTSRVISRLSGDWINIKQENRRNLKKNL